MRTRKPLESQYKKILVGITGGIGAGKTTVSHILKGMGYPVFSADEIAREITETDMECQSEIKESFGALAFDRLGSLDRKYLREKISEDPELKKRLEEITHPRIRNVALAKIQNRFNAGDRIVFYEAPVLFEAKLEHLVDLILCVTAKDEIRIQRIMLRDGTSMEQATRFLQTQLPQAEKARRSHFLIENSSDSKLLEPIVILMLKNLHALLAPSDPNESK